MTCAAGFVWTPATGNCVWCRFESGALCHDFGTSVIELQKLGQSLATGDFKTCQVILVEIPQLSRDFLYVRIAQERGEGVELQLFTVLDLIAKLLAGLVVDDDGVVRLEFAHDI